jgi:hypothetical protein
MASASTKVVGYIRVSTEGQAEGGVSLEAQRAKLVAYCTALDLELVAVEVDAGVSAKTLDRPALQRALATLRAALEALVAETPRLRLGWDAAAPDNVWSAAKFGLYNAREERTKTAWSLVAQVGPRIPTAPDTRRLGGEALLVFGKAWPTQHVVLNVGGAVDPASGGDPRQPKGLEAGLDVDLDIDGRHAISFLGEVGGWRALTDGAHQLHATAGIGWGATDWLTVSASGLVGFLRDGDRYGVLLGASPKWTMWK